MAGRAAAPRQRPQSPLRSCPSPTTAPTTEPEALEPYLLLQVDSTSTPRLVLQKRRNILEVRVQKMLCRVAAENCACEMMAQSKVHLEVSWALRPRFRYKRWVLLLRPLSERFCSMLARVLLHRLSLH